MKDFIHNGIPRSRINSLGEAIADSDITLKEFWDWFGDSATIDKNGCPIALYRILKTDDSLTEDLIGHTYFSSGELGMTSFIEKGVAQIVQFYAQSKNPSIYHAGTRITKSIIEDARSSTEGFDMVYSENLEYFTPIGSDQQLRLSSDFNVDVTPLPYPPEIVWEGRTVEVETGAWNRPVVGKAGNMFFPGQQLIKLAGKTETMHQRQVCTWGTKHESLIEAKKGSLELLKEHNYSIKPLLVEPSFDK